LLPLIQTLFDIVRLRKGPEHIPRSSMLLLMAIALWIFAVLSQTLVIDRRGEADFGYEVLSALIAVICYSVILMTFGKSDRLVQTVTAAFGCSSLLIVALTIGSAVSTLAGSSTLMALFFWTYLPWALAVRGHIIARAIDRHWYLGITFAVLIFVLQYIFVIGFRTN